MTQVAIRVEGLGKRYRLGQQVGYKTLRETFFLAYHTPTRILGQRLLRLRQTEDGRLKTETAGLQSPVSGPQSPVPGPQSPVSSQPDHIWALKDVSFDVKRGEAVGIIGRNGSGKSTLLKILSRITAPTEGRAEIRGRVGSLLEVGTGFHPELTGRENVYLNGAIIGMKKAEIERRFEEIVAFAEIEKFLDTPVKRYSSGMYVRLAFAVAAHLEPEILIVDEVLAVGDAAFQRKCLGKMGDVTKEGRTVLFVSHNLLAIQSLCQRAIWLNEGRVVEDGSADVVAGKYSYAGSPATATEKVWDDIEAAPGNDEVRLHVARAVPENGKTSDAITTETPLVLEFEYWNLEPGAHLNLSLLIYNDQGILVFNATPMFEPVWHGRPFPKGLFRDRCVVPGSLLNDGTYRVDLLVIKDQNAPIYSHASVLTFAVRESGDIRRGAWFGKWAGAVRPRVAWTTQLVTSEPQSGAS